MMKIVHFTWVTFALCVLRVSGGVVDTRIQLIPDSLTYSENEDYAEVSGIDCPKDKAGSGNGTIGNNTIEYRCLSTGTYLNGSTSYAIACGGLNGVRNDVVCHAFSKKQKSSLVACKDVAKNECKGNKDDCPFDCKDDFICDAFPGMEWFTGENYMNQTMMVPSKGKIKISPKRLVAGKSFADDWRQMSGEDLCWFADAIVEKCLETNYVVDNTSLEDCVSTKFTTYYDLDWITSFDKNLIEKTVKQGNLFPPSFLRQQAKEEKRAELKALRAKNKLKKEKAKEQAELRAQKKNQTLLARAEKMAEQAARKEELKEAKKLARKYGNFTQSGNGTTSGNWTKSGNSTTSGNFANSGNSNTTNTAGKRELRVAELVRMFKA